MIDRTICVVLAGGLARRMDNIDKAMVDLDGEPLLHRVIERMASQTAHIVINANGDAARFSRWDLPVIADTIGGFPGPLAGVLAAMEWVKEHHRGCNWVVSVPVDTPFVPRDLVARFSNTIVENNADLTCARSGGRAHPVVGLWPIRLAGDLRQAMSEEKLRKVDLWTARFKLVHTEFETDPVDPFFNINRPEDIEKAEQIIDAAQII